MTPEKIRKRLAFLAMLVAVAAGIVVATVLFARYKPEFTRELLLAQIKNALKRDAKCESAEFVFWPAPSINIKHLMLKEQDRITPFFTAESLTCGVSVLPLFQGKIILQDVAVTKPQVILVRNAAGVWNIQDILDQSKKPPPVKVEALKIQDGILEIVNRQASTSEEAYQFRRVNLLWMRMRHNRESRIRIQADLVQEDAPASIRADGFLKFAVDGQPLSKSEVDFSLSTNGLELNRLTSHILSSTLAIRGRLDSDSRIVAMADERSIRGTARISTLQLAAPKIFQSPLEPKLFRAFYHLSHRDSTLLIKSLRIESDKLTLDAKGSVKKIGGENPFIDLHVTGSEIPRTELDHYLPYGLFNSGTAVFIKEKITQGKFQILEGVLHGSARQFSHMEREENTGALYLKLAVSDGSVLYLKPPLPFQGLKGTLEIKNGQMNFQHFTGFYGDSPISVEGSITNLFNDKTSLFPFTASGVLEVTDLERIIGKDTVGEIEYKGHSGLQLIGQGSLDDYSFTGRWDLTKSFYAYPKVIEKPLGRSNHLSFRISLKNGHWSFPYLQYEIPPLIINGSVQPQSAEQDRMDVSITSNRVSIEDLVALFPMLKDWDPQGRVEAVFRGNGKAWKFDDIVWKGRIMLDDVSCKVASVPGRFEDIVGTVYVDDRSLSTTQMTAHLGHSTLSGKIIIPKLPEADVDLVFSSPELVFADFGLAGPADLTTLKNVRGSILYKKETVIVRSMVAKVRNSSIKLAGKFALGEKPQADIKLDAAQMDIDDIILLAQLKKAGQAEQPEIALTALIQADAGKIQQIPFSVLYASVKYSGHLLEIKDLSFQALNGKCKVSGQALFPSSGPPAFAGTIALSGIAMDQFQKATDAFPGGLISGTLSTEGSISLYGKSKDDILRSSNGAFHFEINNGTLKKFQVLSKIFSILNVSQLFKLQLPDMVTGGMPFRDIRGNITVRDGILTSKDFFIRSEAMNMSFVGQTDLIKRTTAMTVGIQPLQSIDITIGHLPIVGWLLTDDQKRLISVYFDVRGTLSDPSVKPIPVTSLTKGLIDIFRNLFHLPEKLFTDTGDVIFGR
jgi:hypothetical protein